MKTQTWDTAGYTGKQDNIREIIIEPKLEVVKNQYDDRDYITVLKSDEFSSVCPKTGLPDFADITIEYIAGDFLVEQKALKLYLTAYRNLGIFQEHATNKILDDFVGAVKPKWVKITADWKARGGISVSVVAEWPKSES